MKNLKIFPVSTNRKIWCSRACLFIAFLLIMGCSSSDNEEISTPNKTEVIAKGSGFGQGPKIVFWFSGRNKNNKTAVDMDKDPEIGKFVSNRVGSGAVVSKPWNYWYDEKTKRYFVPSINNTGEGGTYFSKNIDMGNSNSEHEGYLISYRSYVPDKYSFPGTTMDQFDNGNFGETGSSFKSAWITSDGDDTANGDLIPWTHSDTDNIQMAGNGVQVGMSNEGSRYVANLSIHGMRNHSPRVLSYIKVPTSFVSGGNVTAEWSFVSTKDHKHYYGQNKTLISNTVPLNHRYIAFPGWADPERNGFGKIKTTQVLLGDIYVAQGFNSRARIEIGDAPKYEDCKWIFIAPPTAWKDTEIKAVFYPDELKKAKYWFVTTTNGTRYSGTL